MPKLDNSTATGRISLSFREFIAVLAGKFGHDHFPYDLSHGVTVDEIVHGNIIHHDLVKELIVNIYKNNQCASVACTIYCDKVFDVLGQTEAKLRQRGDADSLRFINDIGWLCRELYQQKLLGNIDVTSSPQNKNKPVLAASDRCKILSWPIGRPS